MTSRTELEWLADIVAWGERLQRHMVGIDRNAFFGNEMAQDAFCKCIEAVGEAAGKLDDLNPGFCVRDPPPAAGPQGVGSARISGFRGLRERSGVPGEPMRAARIDELGPIDAFPV